MRRILVVLSLITLTGFFPGAAHARFSHATKLFPVTIVDDHGNRIRLNREPKRIISLDPRDTEILFALGLEKRVVGDGGSGVEGATGIVDAQGKPRDFKYPSEWPSRWGRDYPVRSRELPHVEGGCCGTPFNLETIESLQPDLVLGPYSQTELPTFQKMRDLGLHVITVDPSSFHGILKDITLVGRATGGVTQAQAVTATMRTQVAAVKAKLGNVRSRPRVYFEIDATNPTQPITAGPGTYLDEGIRLAGGKNIADTVTTCSGTTCYPAFSLEELVQLNPQLIFFSIYEKIYSSVTPATVKARTGWNTISAVQKNKVYVFNDDLLTRGGPRNSIGIQQLARLIHPDLFKTSVKPAAEIGGDSNGRDFGLGARVARGGRFRRGRFLRGRHLQIV
jgi:iron complex transport system substrate-binding protein